MDIQGEEDESYNVTVLWREEGYTMKYRLSPRDFPRAQAIFHRIPRLESQYSHSQSPLLANIFSYWGLLTSTSQYFLVLRPPDLRRPQYEKILASRGRSIVTVVFQYSIIWWLRMDNSTNLTIVTILVAYKKNMFHLSWYMVWTSKVWCVFVW